MKQPLTKINDSKIDDSKISASALKVVNRLREQGYQAYLVGGCVRDLLLGKLPKDFDVATDAHPGEVKSLFRNSRIVGRRFKIVHVRFGPEIVEVTTFRGPHEDKYDENHTDTGMTVSDNIYGTFEDDAFRRDFAMNALYYDTVAGELIDMMEGVHDISERIITAIGEPEKRFREDPVRMLRAIRFMAKLGFDLNEDTAASIKSLGRLVQNVAPARLFEEVLKLLMSGFGVEAWRHLMEYDLHGWLFPDTGRAIETEQADRLIELALASTDSRISDDLPVTPAFIYAALLWRPFLMERQQLMSRGDINHAAASHEAADKVLGRQQMFTAIPRRFSVFIKEVWFLQFRLPMRVGKKPEALLSHKRFRAAYDFLLLREKADAKTGHLGDWWTEYQVASDQRREEMTRDASRAMQRKRNRRRQRGEHRARDK